MSSAPPTRDSGFPVATRQRLQGRRPACPRSPQAGAGYIRRVRRHQPVPRSGGPGEAACQAFPAPGSRASPSEAPGPGRPGGAGSLRGAGGPQQSPADGTAPAPLLILPHGNPQSLLFPCRPTQLPFPGLGDTGPAPWGSWHYPTASPALGSDLPHGDPAPLRPDQAPSLRPRPQP